MSKKRVTRTSSKQKNQNLLEFEFRDDPQSKNQDNSPPQKQKASQKPSKLNTPSQINDSHPKPLKHPQQQSIKSSRSRADPINPNQPIPALIKKKKVTKQEQNEGLRVIKEKQTQNIFRHFCTQEGLITIESLGSVLVRAKKEFETQDVENMIAYFDTITRKVKEEEDKKAKDERNDEKVQQRQQKLKYVKSNNKKKLQRLQRKESLDNQDCVSVGLVSQSDEQRSIDQQMDLDLESQEEIKTELNYEEFKLLLKYLDKE